MDEHDLQVVCIPFPDREIAITVSSGKPTPVSKINHCWPKVFTCILAKHGRKIKLPAPKIKKIA